MDTGVPPVAVVSDPGAAASLLDPARRAILDQLGQAGSAASVARKLRLPRQRVRYHVRELERQGLLESAGSRQRGNCTEQLVRVRARRFVLSPAVIGEMAAEPGTGDRLSAAYLVGAATRTAKAVAELQECAQSAGKRLATFTLEAEVRFASPAAQQAFTVELAEALGRLLERHGSSAPGSRGFRVLMAGHPGESAGAAAGHATEES